MSEACGGMYGGEEKCIQDYGWEDCRKATWKTGINVQNSCKMVIKWD